MMLTELFKALREADINKIGKLDKGFSGILQTTKRQYRQNYHSGSI